MLLKWWARGQVIILTTFHECFIFYPVYVTVCTSYIHWKLCCCLYCFYPIIFSAKYKRSMLNYFAAVIVWKTAWWDYEMRNGGTLEWKEHEGFLKKGVPTKSRIQTIDRKNVKNTWIEWFTSKFMLDSRRMIPWNPEFTVDLPRMKAKIVWVTVTSLLYCLARKKEKTRLAALKIHV